MTGKELDAAIAEFGLTMAGAAERFGCGVRSLYRYVKGDRPVPKPIALAIKQQKELRQIRALAAKGVW